ncbi:unnamed protein product [Caenorhabditis brenneri]
MGDLNGSRMQLCFVFFAFVFTITLYYRINDGVNIRSCESSIASYDVLNKTINTSSGLIQCETLLTLWNTEIPVLIVDVEFLNKLSNSDCHQNIGVDIEFKSTQSLVDGRRFEVIYYSRNVSKDFMDFDIDGRRIIPKRFEMRSIGNIRIPSDLKTFIGFWKRSKFVDCVGLKVARNESEEVTMPGQTSSDILARLRDELIDNGMFPFLSSGTFLGWYRECSMIPHTWDMDLAISYDNYNPEYLKKLENGDTQFKILRRLGMVENSLEMTVIPKKEEDPRIDIFIMYDGIENGTLTHSYISGLDIDGTKYKWSNPIYDPWCSAELHGHIFWVSCTPKSKIIFEFGDFWYLDKPTSTYSWNSASKNVKAYGKFTEEEMKEVYIVY